MHSILLAKSFDLDGFSMAVGRLVCCCCCCCVCIKIHTLLHVSVPVPVPHVHERASAHDKLHTMTYLAKEKKI